MALDQNGLNPIFDSYGYRKDHWYIILTVYDQDLMNCLVYKHPMQNKVIEYLKALKTKYLNTQNHETLLLTKKS